MSMDILSFIRLKREEYFEKKYCSDKIYKSVYTERYFKRNKRHRMFDRFNQRVSDMAARHLGAAALIMLIGVPSLIVASVVVLSLIISSPIVVFMNI